MKEYYNFAEMQALWPCVPFLSVHPLSSSPAGKDLVPEQEVKVQEAAQARRQPARERPDPGLHVPVPALADHPSNLGRVGLFQRSKHAGQQLHARLLSLVLLPAPRLHAEIGRRGRRLGAARPEASVSPAMQFSNVAYEFRVI